MIFLLFSSAPLADLAGLAGLACLAGQGWLAGMAWRWGEGALARSIFWTIWELSRNYLGTIQDST